MRTCGLRGREAQALQAAGARQEILLRILGVQAHFDRMPVLA